jgi:TonB-dependent starch-binding outer membrane protein SusC
VPESKAIFRHLFCLYGFNHLINMIILTKQIKIIILSYKIFYKYLKTIVFMQTKSYPKMTAILVACLLSLGWMTTAAGQTVKGKVTDEKGEALIGVNIVVKETSKGTTTDLDGMYSIEVSGANSILVFTYLGYEPKEVVVNSLSVVNVTLSPDSKVLSEVVVIGYGTQRK